MRVRVFTIEKSEDRNIEAILKEYQKMSKRFCELEFIRLFDKNLANSQKMGAQAAKESYEAAYLPYLENSFSIALDERGREIDSQKFSLLFNTHSTINFFIGGAYGFGDSFLKKVDDTLSLSRLTFSHKLTKLLLAEQIFRALAIKNNHPYHK